MPTEIGSNLDLGGVTRIVNAPIPIAEGDLATKSYVDARASGFIGIRYIKTGIAYVPTPGTSRIAAQLIGGGGGGGGINPVITAAAGGGAGGECFTGLITLPIASSFVIAIGAAGTGATAGNNTGGTGGTTTLTIGGIVYTANGGVGGLGSGTATSSVTGGLGGAAINGALNVPGRSGRNGFSTKNADTSVGGAGADSSFGAGGRSLGNSNGNSPGAAATGYGAGGGGARASTAVIQPGGAGAPGLLVIHEYA